MPKEELYTGLALTNQGVADVVFPKLAHRVPVRTWFDGEDSNNGGGGERSEIAAGACNRSGVDACLGRGHTAEACDARVRDPGGAARIAIERPTLA